MKTETFSPQNDCTTELNVNFLLTATVRETKLCTYVRGGGGGVCNRGIVWYLFNKGCGGEESKTCNCYSLEMSPAYSPSPCRIEARSTKTTNLEQAVDCRLPPAVGVVGSWVAAPMPVTT